MEDEEATMAEEAEGEPEALEELHAVEAEGEPEAEEDEEESDEAEPEE